MSTTDKLRGAIAPKDAAPTPAAQKRTNSLLNFILAPSFQAQMKLALPRTLTAERLTRIVMTECRKTPKLLDCTRDSFLGAVLQCAQLGLEPGGALGHCYLLPFGKGKSKDEKPTCQLIIGYRGMLDLARRSGQIVSISAYCVHKKDDFHYCLGLRPDIQHTPSSDADRGPITYVYAVAVLKDGGLQFEVMSRAEIEDVRKQSKNGNSGPWEKHFDEMARKGLALDTPIPTTSGWTTMADIQPGDVVFDKDGKPTTVTSVSEVKNLPCFKVTFSNGVSVTCDNEHRWLARAGDGNACRKPFSEMTINEMYAAKQRGLSVTVPVQGALDLPDAELPIDPYLFGYWLGDGTSRWSSICCDEDDLSHVKQAIVDAGFSVGTVRRDPRSLAVNVGIVNGMGTKLKEMGLLMNKHVPEIFLRSSIEQRKALLAGLLDSDGWADKRSRAHFVSSSRDLRDAVFELACSLGEVPNKRDYSATLFVDGERKKFPAFSLEWTPSFNPFRLARKAERIKDREISKYFAVKSIRKVDSVPTKCIAVDSPSRTYLCGEGMTVTHNTVIRRLFKYLPVSIEAARAVEIDERADLGETVTQQDFIDAEFVDSGRDASDDLKAAAPVEDIEPAPKADAQPPEAKVDSKPAATASQDDDWVNAYQNELDRAR